MVRNIVVLGGSSHPELTESICSALGIPPAKALLGKFAVGETRVEIRESVRGKDVFIVQSGGGKVNDHLMELLITISACKIASASRITAVLPMFPYSRQSEVPYNKPGAPLVRGGASQKGGFYTFDSRPQTPHVGPHDEKQLGNGDSLPQQVSKLQLTNGINGTNGTNGTNGLTNGHAKTAHFAENEKSSSEMAKNQLPVFEPQRGYRPWVAQSGKLVSDLLTAAGADHIITMDLHDAQYQGFFDIPVDNLYGRQLLRKYIEHSVPNYRQAVIVSPDAGGAKRATAIADSLGMPFALIHKERRPTQFSERQTASMMLVGDVINKTVILIDDMADTCTTVTRAANLLKREGATKVYALVTHGILSGEAIERIKSSGIDKMVVTDSIDQSEHKVLLGDKLDILPVGNVFAEAIRRVHHGESISTLFQHN
ncbi:ribose-phosphate pyrophosphokinase [Microthyrium microscopicum]|uniref:Ribose-phosphate pyrophosphokinase n=1 Tax=Microthyrium microscopicum TaxID=703497 RepID=A0A6A6U2X7_9PEZI|nr:ribose-phosphate pyrophosphokinase [Microthyrium microscopicum]